MKKILVLLARVLPFFTCYAIAAACCWYWISHRPITYEAGVLVPGEPTQVDLPTDKCAFDFANFHLKPLARFTLDARLLHSRIYRFDPGARLAPIDLAVGWGPMSDQQVLDRLHISQSMRFFWYGYQNPPPVPRDQIIGHATNIHIIPSTPELGSRCKSLRNGALVHLAGELVEATGPRIATWRSSLSRTDTGNGACELLYLTEMEVLSSDDSNKRRLAGR